MSWGETLFLKKIIERKQSLVASDNLFAVVHKGLYLDTNNEPRPLIKMNTSGSCKLYFSKPDANRAVNLRIYLNNTQVTYLPITYENTASKTSSNIVFKKGDILSIAIYAEGTAANLSTGEIQLLADLIDNSAITIL